MDVTATYPGTRSLCRSRNYTTTCPIDSGMLSQHSARGTCPFCHREITTVTEYESGLLTWLIAAGSFLVGGIVGHRAIGMLPFFLRDFKDVLHICPNCGGLIGRYKRLVP